VLVGAKRHITVDFALRLLGLGCPTLVAAEVEGRMPADALETFREALYAGHAPARYT
jgi:hypothetical protein